MLAINSAGGIGPMDISNVSAGSKKDAKASASDAFSSIMNAAAGKNVDTSKIDNSSIEAKNDITKTDITKTVENASSKQTESKSETTKVETTKKSEIKDEVDNSEITDEIGVGTDVTDNEELKAAVSQAIIDLYAKLQDLLGVSEADIDAALENLSMDPLDLLDENGLKGVLLELTGASEVNLLVDENLAGLLEAANVALEEVMTGLEEVDLESVGEVFEGEDFAEILGRNIDADMTSADELSDANIEEGSGTTVASGTEVNEKVVVTAEKSTGESSEGFENHESASESIVANLNQAFANIADVESVDVSPVEQYADIDIVNQLIDEIKVNIHDEQTTLSVTLNPETLGHVNITVENNGGALTAKIVAETEAAKNAIEANLETLKETFNNQEIKVEAVEVTVASYDYFSNQNFDQENKGANEGDNQSKGLQNINLNADIDSENVDSDLEIQMEMMKANGQRISIQA